MMGRDPETKEVALRAVRSIEEDRNEELRGLAKFSPCSFHGKFLKSLEFGGIRLTEVSYGPNFQNKEHSHEYAYIGVTLNGRSTQICRNHVRSSEPWTIMYHPVGEVHYDRFHEQGAREFNIELSSGRLQRLCEHSGFLQGAVQMHRGKAGWVAARLYSEFRLMDDLSWLAIEGLTIQLIAEIARHDYKMTSPKSLPWLRRVEDIIQSRFTERLTLGELARSAGVHPVHVAREFHRHKGCTIGQRIRQLRIEQACQMLMRGDSALADVAVGVGFPDQSQFTKTFKNLVGVTPSEYRRLKQPR